MQRAGDRSERSGIFCRSLLFAVTRLACRRRHAAKANKSATCPACSFPNSPPPSAKTASNDACTTSRPSAERSSGCARIPVCASRSTRSRILTNGGQYLLMGRTQSLTGQTSIDRRGSLGWTCFRRSRGGGCPVAPSSIRAPSADRARRLPHSYFVDQRRPGGAPTARAAFGARRLAEG